MANEAVIIELLGNKGDPVRFTCASGTGIEKGAILELADPRTVTSNNGSGDVFGGIAAAEKKSDDYSTTISAYTYGIFDLTCDAGATIVAGTNVSTSGANQIKEASEAELAAGKGIGKALEDATGAEVIAVMVGRF